MRISRHARTRLKQRGISRDSLEIIWRYGRESLAPGGVYKLFFGQKECSHAISELKRMIQMLERAKNGTVITAKGDIITVCNS